jgi:hypothetical protein
MTTSTKQRSPNYPANDLAASITDLSTLYRKNGRSKIGLEPAARGLGYKSLSGPSRSRIAAMRHYGLIEMGGGLIWPSERGVLLAMRSPESPEYKEAVREAAMTPEIFRELAQTHLEAGEDALRHYLVAVKRFSPDGARRLAETFRDTMRLVSLDEPSYDEGMVQSTGLLERQNRTEREREGLRRGQEYSWPLSGNVTAKVVFSGGKVTAKEIAMLAKYLDLAKEAIEDDPGYPDDE